MNLLRTALVQLGAVVSLLPVMTRDLPAQQAAADSAWVAGDFAAARRGYEQVLAANPQSVRANYRIGILVSWDGKLDSALVLIRRARAIEPAEPDLQIAEARILAWDSRFDDALMHYDSVIARYPARSDAVIARAQTLAWAGRWDEADAAYRGLLAREPANLDAASGRAQLTAWRGDLSASIEQYQAVLARDPHRADALAGLGQVYLWRGQVREASEQSRRAREADSTSRTVRDLSLAVRMATRPQPELTLGWSNDSDHNTSWWQSLTASVFIADGFRVFGSVGGYEASDPVRKGTRLSAEAGVSYGLGNFGATAAVGVRQLSPAAARSYTAGTVRASASYRLSSRAGVGVGYSHYPFDETALLIERGHKLDALELSFDLTMRPGLTLGGGAGYTWLSDGNARRSGILAVTQTIHHDFWAGAMVRSLGYDFKGVGYFSPDRFTVAEGRGGWSRSWTRWHARLSGGLGLQQVTRAGRSQAEWHLEGRIGRDWSPLNMVELFGGISNSAESSTTGAFRYRTAGIVVRIGL